MESQSGVMDTDTGEELQPANKQLYKWIVILSEYYLKKNWMTTADLMVVIIK